MISPPIEWPTSASRSTGTGQASVSSCRRAESATPFSRRARPVLARSRTGVQPRSASVSAYVAPTTSRCRSKDDSLSDRPCRRTATRPVASGKVDRRASVRSGTSRPSRRTASGTASRGRSRARRSPMIPFTAALATRPGSVSSRAGPTPSSARAPKPAESARSPAPSPAYTPDATPRWTCSGTRDSLAVEARSTVCTRSAHASWVSRTVRTTISSATSESRAAASSRRGPDATVMSRSSATDRPGQRPRVSRRSCRPLRRPSPTPPRPRRSPRRGRPGCRRDGGSSGRRRGRTRR